MHMLVFNHMQVAPSLLQSARAHATPLCSATADVTSVSASTSFPSASSSAAEGQQQQQASSTAAAGDEEDAVLPPLPLVETANCLAAAFLHCRQPLGLPSQEAAEIAGVSGATEKSLDASSRGDELVACTARILSLPLPWQQVRAGGEHCQAS